MRQNILFSAVIIMAAIIGFGTGALSIAPRIVTNTVTLPAPSPQIIRVDVPGPTITVAPASCVEALRLNAELWSLNSKFLDYLTDDNADWSDAQTDRFGAVSDDFIAASAACANAATPESTNGS